MNCFRLRARPDLVAAALLLLLLPMATAMAREGGEGEAKGFDAWFDRALAQGEGITTDWEGSVVGDVTARIGGQAKLHFFELENGRLKMQLYLGGDHQYFGGVMLGGVVSCARGTRTYPVWVRQRVGEDQPFGRLALMYTDEEATVSRRIGVSPPPSHDIYEAESGRITLTLLEDRLAVKINSVMSAGPIRQGSVGVNPRIRLRAQSSVERTLENERLFDTSRCEGRAPFEVVSVKPEDGRRNVLEDQPQILVELSEDVHPESLRNPDLIVVRTLRRIPEGDPGLAGDDSARDATAPNPLVPVPFALADESPLEERVAGSIELRKPNVLHFIPDAPLRTGVRYQIDLATGDGGIRSQDFHVLDEHLPVWFTTRVEPDDVRVDVYQTTRNAPLIERKPALARVYVDWSELREIHPDWQVQEARFDVRLTQQDENKTLVSTDSYWVKRPDLYDDEDKRLARDSVNLFGWEPRKAHGEEVVARVRPYDPYPEVREREIPEYPAGKPVEFARSQLDEVVAEPVIVRMGNWRENPPKAETIAHVMRAFVLDNEYSRQVYPVLKVRAAPLAFFEPPPVADWWNVLWFQAKILDTHYGQFSQSDVVVGYYPPELGDGRGQGIVKYRNQQSNVVLMPVAETDWSPVPAIVNAPLVAHEYGHIFGLKHVPDVDAAGRDALCSSLASYLQPSEGIEGFRILAGGREGHSKSSTTGNGEKAPSLKQLMFPCQFDARAMWWISDEYYKQLVKDLPGLIRGQRLTRRVMVMTAPGLRVGDRVKMDRSRRTKPADARWVMVSGFTDGTRTDFLPAVEVPRPGVHPDPGSDHRLVVESADGTVLASQPVDLHREGDQAYFSATLELAGDPARVRLTKDGKPVGELLAGAAPAPPRIVSHEDGAVLGTGDVLRWRPVPDAGAVRYSVRYYAGSPGPVRVLAALTDKTELALDPAGLPHGEAPVIEVIAHTGLHEARTRLRVQLPDTLRPMLVHPVGEMPDDDEADIGAWFPAQLVPDSLQEDGARLLDASGAEVPVRAFVDPNGSGVRIVPQAPLAPEAEYTVHLAPGLEAVDGRVVASAVRWSFRTAAESEDGGVMDVRQLPLPRAVTPLPPLPGGGGAEAMPAASERATGEATLIGTDAMQVPVSFSVCESAQNPSARVLLDGRFGREASAVRFRLERAGGDALVLSVQRPSDGGLLSARLQGALDQPGGTGLTVTEHQGHWNLSAMLDFEDGRKPLLMRADCGLP